MDQDYKMDCESCDDCEIANRDCIKKTQSRKEHNSVFFLTIRRNRNIRNLMFKKVAIAKVAKIVIFKVFLWKIDQSELDTRSPEFSSSNFISG